MKLLVIAVSKSGGEGGLTTSPNCYHNSYNYDSNLQTEPLSQKEEIQMHVAGMHTKVI